MRAIVLFCLAGSLFAQKMVLFPANCTYPVIDHKFDLEISKEDSEGDAALAAILDDGYADTDMILGSNGKADYHTGSVDPFFLYTPSRSMSAIFNIKLADNLARWKWKVATCPGLLLLQILPRQATLVIERQPNGQNREMPMRPDAKYAVATLLHVHYSFKKMEERRYAVTADVSLDQNCKEFALQAFEFRGAYGTGEYPGPTLSCKGQPVYVYHPRAR